MKRWRKRSRMKRRWKRSRMKEEQGEEDVEEEHDEEEVEEEQDHRLGGKQHGIIIKRDHIILAISHHCTSLCHSS